MVHQSVMLRSNNPLATSVRATVFMKAVAPAPQFNTTSSPVGGGLDKKFAIRRNCGIFNFVRGWWSALRARTEIKGRFDEREWVYGSARSNPD
jgi:hypothetical protein